MAERTWLENSFSNPYGEDDPYRDGASFSDYPKAFASRAAGLGADLSAAVRAAGEGRDDDSKAAEAQKYLGHLSQNLFGALENETLDSMTPTSKRDLQSTFTDPNFWSLNAMALKSANMAPDIMAAAIPSIIFPGVGTAVVVAAAQGGALSASSVVDDMYKMTDSLSDAELQKQVPMYRDMRQNGTNEEDARVEYNKVFRGMRPVIAGAIGALTNVFGPAGQAARAVSGVGGSILSEAGEGIASRTAKGFAEGAISEGIQSGVEDYETQSGAVAGQMQSGVNMGQVAESAATGAVLGGVLGGAVSAAHGGHAPHTVVDEALGLSADTNGPAPSPMASSVSASGTSAQPGVPSIDVEGVAESQKGAAETVASVSQQMQARKNFGMDYDSLSADQKATVDTKTTARGLPTNKVEVVTAAAPDPAQAVALDVAKPAGSAQEAPAIPPVDAMRPAEQPLEQAAPVTEPTPNSEVPAAGTPEPVLDTPPAPEAAGRPPVAEPATVDPASVPPQVTPQGNAEPVQTGPRILRDMTQPDYAAENAAIVAKNIRGMDAPEEAAPKGRNRTTAEQQERVKTREGAAALAQKYAPSEQEAGLLSKRPKEVQAARKLIFDRAKVISDEANQMGLALPKAFRDNARSDDAYNPETLLVMEARRLATRQNPTLADYQRFQSRELDVRSGAMEQAVSERRAEGDAAMRQASEVQADTLTDADTPADRMTPEDHLIAKEEAGESRPRRAERPTPKEDIPDSVSNALDDALYTTPKADRRAPVVETRKTRKLAPKLEAAKERVTTKPANEAVDEAITNTQRSTAPKVTTEVTTPEVAPRLQDVKARVERARQETNINPTPAQAIAGNYKKGKVSIHGVSVAIENPKGSIRTNKNPDGPKWKVKMPADYGYIEGTRGADGDPVDVYVGPHHDAGYVYVVDQLDMDTRAFDEHKALMGFNSQSEALNAYDRAYSDGNGMLRVGDIRKMTVAEFKDWANSDPKERSGLSEEQANEARSMLIEDDLDSAVSALTDSDMPEGYVRDPQTREVARPISTQKANDVLAQLDMSTLTGAPRVIAGTARSILSKIVGDVDVHFLSPEDLKRMSGYTGYGSPLGYHSFRGNMEAVFLRSDLMNDPEKLRHALLHEVTHAATVRRVLTDRNLESNIHDLMYYTQVGLRKATEADRGVASYALTDPREFVAEAFSNPEFQEALSRIPVDNATAEHFGLGQGVRTMWDALISNVRRILGLPKTTHSMLEAAIRVTERAMTPTRVEEVTGRAFLEDGNLKPLKDSMRDSLNSILKRPDLAPTKGNPQLIGLRTLDNIARMADRYFRGNPVVRNIANIIEGQRVAAIKEFDRAAPIIQKLHDLQTKYRGVTGIDGHSQWENFSTLVHDETMAGVYADRPLADQKHISKEGAKDSWRRAQYPDLARRHASLPAELQAARKEAMGYFKDKQNEVALKLIRNRIVTLFDTADPEALAERIHNGTVTDADKALMGETYDAIAAAGTLSKIDGPYFPLMRRGNFVVKGRYNVTEPGNSGTRISENEFEFTDKDAAGKYAASQTGRPSMRTIYVDKLTGETTGTENGKTVRLTANDMNAEARYRVVVQDRHMEMFDTMREARARVAELRASGINADDAVPRSFENYGIQADALSVQMRKLSTVLDRKADDRQFTPEQKHELLSTLNEVSLSMLGSTRIQSRSLPRQYVAGASKDLVRNTTDYAHSMGNYVAKLDWRPKLDAELSNLKDAVADNQRDGFAAGRTAIYNEILKRVTSANPAMEHKKWNAVSSRILSMSFIDKLMSPSYSLVNATQPMMTTAPYLAGQYGAGKAYSAMAKAYSDIGSMAAIKRGFADTLAKAKPGNNIVATDPVSLIRNRLTNKGEQALLDILIERGAIDTDSGLEVGKIVQEGKGIVGAVDKGIGYLEGIARQMPKTIEAINRSVSAIAAYRLEMERSGDTARAVQFAQDTVNQTQFNYSASNTSPLMNHPVLRLMLQFKKYGVGMYQLLGEQAALAIRNENPGDRARAIKSLSYTIGMHVVMAGAMGLPTEPIRLAVLAANGLGLTDWSWEDVEVAQREAMADMFGKQFGEIVSRGVPRALGIDLSSRMGIDTLVGPFGEPRSNEAQDWKAYVWDTVSGAPAGLVADWAKGVNDLAQGDVIRAAERLIPVKALSDSIKAYRQMTEGTVSERTGKKVMDNYTVGEAITRGLGFAPSREAEGYERSSMFYRGKDKQDEVRSEFQREWVQSNGASRGRLWRDIQKWNKAQPAEARLSLSDLRGYQKKMNDDMKNTKAGITARRREQHILDRADSTYDFSR